MNRKKAIFSLLVIGTGATAIYSGISWFNIAKKPDLNFISQHQALIDELAERIIPRSDTPGAKDVMAGKVIVTLLKNTSDRKTQNNFIDGLKNVEKLAFSKFDKNFIHLSVVQQNSIVQHFYEEGRSFTGKIGKAKNKILGKTFFNILKQYTTIAFCTSKEGATEALAFDLVPGEYIGCMPLSVNQRSWATK